MSESRPPTIVVGVELPASGPSDAQALTLAISDPRIGHALVSVGMGTAESRRHSVRMVACGATVDEIARDAAAKVDALVRQFHEHRVRLNPDTSRTT